MVSPVSTGMGDRVRVRLCNVTTSHPGRLTFYPLQDGKMSRPYQPKGGDALRLGSKGRNDLFEGKTACCHI